MPAVLRARKIIIAALFLFIAAKAYSLGVSPAAVFMQSIIPGEDRDTGQDLVISNENDSELEVSIEVIKPIMPGGESLQAYSPLPNLKFVYTDNKTLTIPAKGQSKTRVHINIPGEDKYYNQNWAFSIRVVSEKAGFIRVAVAPFFIIETVSKVNVNEKPAGSLGLVPGVIEIKREDIKKKKAVFSIYNNTKAEQKYNIKSYVPSAVSAGFQTEATGWHEWLNDAKWVQPVKDEIKIGSDERKEAELTIDLPESLEAGEDRKGWEVLIIVESGNKERRFARLRILK